MPIKVMITTMWNKIYLSVIAISIAIMAFFTFYASSWLQSIGSPLAAISGYEYHSDMAWIAIWITTIALLLIANAVLWATGKSWAVWATLVYFAVFIVIRYFWLDQAYFTFKKQNVAFDGSFSIAPLLGVFLILLVAVIAFFDQFIILELRNKTYGEVETVAEAVDAEAAVESN